VIAETVERDGEVNVVEEFRILRREFNQKIGVITRKNDKLVKKNDMLVKKIDQLVEELLLQKATIGLLQKSVESSTTRALQDVPFSKVGKDWVADPIALFIFRKGVIIGHKNPACKYGRIAVLSVDGSDPGSNCPSRRGSVTFGINNEASGESSSVLGGVSNRAQGDTASVLGGNQNEAIGASSVAMGGHRNTAMGYGTSIAGGLQNTCDGSYNSILGGFKHELGQPGEPGKPVVFLTFPESPFSCNKNNCSTRKNFKFKNLSVKRKFCVGHQCQ